MPVHPTGHSQMRSLQASDHRQEHLNRRSPAVAGVELSHSRGRNLREQVGDCCEAIQILHTQILAQVLD